MERLGQLNFSSEGRLVSKMCDWCKKEEKAFLVFWKPRSWIKHKTPDGLDVPFCSLACFQKFTGAKLSPKPVKLKEHNEGLKEPLVAAPTQ